MLLSVTSTNEGEIFVSAEDTANTTLAEYVQNIFPTLNETQANSVAAEYAGLEGGNVTDQAELLYGEGVLSLNSLILMTNVG